MALSSAASTLKAHQQKKIHDPDRAHAYQAYRKAIEDYENALSEMM